ncbi:FAD/NAD(P)-binding protein [Amycolatopsis sp. cg5]|uniref:FAD/NAD(P)-binding protein n=1 Tax=Amycolatopsis sp. cg5 TaxID=3238802 RepID=UPI0035243497
MAFELAIVGAGPRGICVLERLSANAPELLTGTLVVHLIDPFPPGPGRVWRYDQSPLLRMNSMPEDVTMFTDETVEMSGPVRNGPSLAEWAKKVRTGKLDASVPDDLLDELRTLKSTSFPTRRLQSAYLDWVYQHILNTLPDGIEVVEHHTHAVNVTENAVWLKDSETPLRVDAVLMTVGHLDALPDERELELAEYAVRNDLAYYPAGYTADVDYADVPAGEPVLVRGFGLAFVDLMLLLTEGRGGRFEEQPCGGLRYHPSGREPVLHVGSRRGVPYHAKTGYRLRGKSLQLPRFFDSYTFEKLPQRLDFKRDVWPHMAKEIAWGYYSELFTGHPDRVRLDFAVFADTFADTEWDSPEMVALIEKSVPAAEDRLDLEQLDRPLAGLRFETGEEFGKHVREYVERDLSRRADVEFSADLGAFMALLSVYHQLPALAASGRITARTQVSEMDGWWHGFFSYYASGPPPRRLEELLALHQAGLVSFAGAEMRITAADGTFVGASESFPGEVRARTLIEARLPEPSVSRASDLLLRTLRDAGDLVEESVLDTATGQRELSGRIHTRVGDSRLLDSGGDAHPRLFAVGPHTSARSAAAFTRPRTNALPFRQNDAVARELLALTPRAG